MYTNIVPKHVILKSVTIQAYVRVLFAVVYFLFFGGAGLIITCQLVARHKEQHGNF